jgi:hypothetical protein
LIGLQLVSAAILQEQHPKPLLGELAEWSCTGHEDPERDEADSSTDGARVLLCRVPGGDVAGFVPEHAGKLRLVVEERKDATRDVDVTAGKREGVDRRHVHDAVMPWQIRPFRRLRELHADAADVLLEIGIVVEAHLLLHLRVGFLTGRNLLRLAHQVELALACGGIGRARERRDERDQCERRSQSHH